MIGKIIDYISDKLLTLCLQIMLIGLGFEMSWIAGVIVLGLIILYYTFKFSIYVIDKSVKEGDSDYEN